MKALLSTVLLLLLATQAQGSSTAAQVFARASPSVFSISVLMPDGSGRIGSGVAVAQGVVATNYHVVEGARRIYVKQGEASTEVWLDRFDKAHDIAALRAMTLRAPPIAFGSAQAVAVGQSVYAIGSPRGLDLSLSEGLVSSRRTVADGDLIQTTAPISPGSSGGGLFDEHARLIGLTTGQVTSGQNLNFAIPVEWLRYVGVLVVASKPKAAPTPNERVTPVTDTASAAPLQEAPPATAPAPAPTPALEPPPSAAPAPVSVPATPAPPPAAETGSGNIYYGFALLAAVLLLAKPAINGLTDWLSREPGQGAPGARARVRPAVDRVAPYRARAREEIKTNTRDADLWLQALEQTGGDEPKAVATYIDLRAQSLYRADLDRKWAEAQAQNQGFRPPRNT